jgi:hypothetical protein
MARARHIARAILRFRDGKMAMAEIEVDRSV